MVKCPNCGNEVSRDEFCSKCGLKLNHTSKKHKHYCPKCGFETSVRDEFCQKCGAKINGKSDNRNLLSFNKTNLYPIILGFIFLLIAILFASRLVLVLCLFAAGFFFEFKSDNAFLNSILVAVIPGILFIITMQNIYYLLMCFIPPIAGCFIAATYRRR